jgi:hypothetical protein
MIGYGNSVFLRTAWEVSSGVPPVNTVAPAITGTAQEGETVTCSTGTWTGTPTITFAYQWKRNGSNIGSATNSTYVLVTADVAQSITCEVTATNGSGSASATSNTITPIAVLLLDAYSGAAIAYSLRKLRSAYSGSAIRVRRSSDNAEQDFGFVSDVLDTASLITFCGAGNGFVTTWYDQSTNANNATQATAANQAQIVSSGAIITDPITGKISATWTADNYTISNVAVTQNMLMSAVVNRTATNNNLFIFGSTSSTPSLYAWGNTGNATTRISGETVTHESGNTTTGAYIMSALRDSSNIAKAWRNTTALATGLASGGIGIVNFTRFGTTSATPMTARCVEAIFWNNDKESSRADIVTNQNDYWEVY